jgi:hypothetical protein
MKGLTLALAATIVLGCATSAPPPPSFDLQQMVDDAIAEAQRLADRASVDLPATLAETLEQNGIELPAVPTNAREICGALGTPSADTSPTATLRSLIEKFVTGGEVGLAIGLLTTVVFTTCPIWSPHLETAIDEFL